MSHCLLRFHYSISTLSQTPVLVYLLLSYTATGKFSNKVYSYPCTAARGSLEYCPNRNLWITSVGSVDLVHFENEPIVVNSRAPAYCQYFIVNNICVCFVNVGLDESWLILEYCQCKLDINAFILKVRQIITENSLCFKMLFIRLFFKNTTARVMRQKNIIHRLTKFLWFKML